MQSRTFFALRHLWIILLSLSMLVSVAVLADDISGPLTIDASNVANYQGRDIAVVGGTVTINVPLSLTGLRVRNGATVTHIAGLTGGLQLTITGAGDCTIETGGAISVNGRGYPGGEGPGRGNGDNTGSYGGGGASYGGEGRATSGAAYGPTYGIIQEPQDLGANESFGSGGGSGYRGSYAGATGGGAIRLNVGGTLRVDGQLQANGNGNTYGGAGSGGSLYLTVGTLAGSGAISAYGGNANGNGGSGGGGRIAIEYANSVTNYTGILSAAGGNCDYGWAGAGTIFFKHISQTRGDLLVHNDGHLGNATVLTAPEIFDNVTVDVGGILTAPYQETINLTVTGILHIKPGGWVSVSGRGNAGGEGPGAGKTDNTGSYGGGGGGYGGNGRATSGAAGGTAYGSETLPTDVGSGGGSGYSGGYVGARGGGAAYLRVNGTLRIDGQLQANGIGNTYGGAGSGGSLLLRVGEITGGGAVTAYGGSAGGNGGAGGGGRIAIYYHVDNFTGTLSANGGNCDYGPAGNGTVYKEHTEGNFTVSLSLAPLQLGSGQQATGQVTISSPAPEGGIGIALTSSNSNAATVPTSVTIPTGQTSATFTVQAQPLTQVQSSNITARLWDQVSSQSVTIRPWLSSLRLNPTSVNAGATVTGTLMLNVAAPANGLTVNLTSSDPAATVPATINVTAGATTLAFTINTSSVASARTVTVRATYLSETREATLYLNPAGVQVRSLTVSPGSVAGGLVATGVVTLNAPAPNGGAIVALASANSSVASLPASIMVPAGKTAASFSITTYAVATPQSILLTATLGVTRMQTLIVRLPGVQTLVLVPDTLSGGDTSVGIVTLDAVPKVPVTVTVTSNRTEALPEPSFIIPAGQTTGSFLIATTQVTSLVQSEITASANDLYKTRVLTINRGNDTSTSALSGTIALEDCANLVQALTFEFRPEDNSGTFQRTTTLGSDGSFTLADLPRKSYVVRIKGGKWLAKVISVDMTAGDTVNVTASLLGGDANDDNSVDVFDLDLIIQAFDAVLGDPSFNGSADLNCDDSVDVFDLDLLIRNFDQAGDE